MCTITLLGILVMSTTRYMEPCMCVHDGVVHLNFCVTITLSILFVTLLYDNGCNEITTVNAH